MYMFQINLKIKSLFKTLLHLDNIIVSNYCNRQKQNMVFMICYK